MSTSDQQEQGPLTRKQLREMRLAGSAPLTPKAQKAQKKKKAQAVPPPAAEPAPPVVAPKQPAGVDVDPHAAPLTRRQAREQERIRTASVPVLGTAESEKTGVYVEGVPVAEKIPVVQDVIIEDTVAEEAPAEEEVPVVEAEMATASASGDDDDDDAVDDEIFSGPVNAASAVQSGAELPLEETTEQGAAPGSPGIDVRNDDKTTDDDALAEIVGTDDAEPAEEERPTVNAAFGSGVLGERTTVPSAPAASFDQLLSANDSTGSQHIAPSALIFTHSPGEGSLSGPVASTGEVLVTGSYELPQGIGSQGHAHGTTDGKEVDAVLIDGELPPASSPTPIAASAAVSTIKPDGEVIRPPAPEKGNKLMITLAIVSGGLALALGAVLIIAFTTNLFS